MIQEMSDASKLLELMFVEALQVYENGLSRGSARDIESVKRA